MGFKWTLDMIKKNGEKKVVKIVFFHLLEFQENGYENWLDSIFITKKQNYLQWSTSLWQNREYCSANRFISCYSTEVYSTELQHLTASYCIKYFILYEFPFLKFNCLTLRGNHGPFAVLGRTLCCLCSKVTTQNGKWVRDSLSKSGNWTSKTETRRKWSK